MQLYTSIPYCAGIGITFKFVILLLNFPVFSNGNTKVRTYLIESFPPLKKKFLNIEFFYYLSIYQQPCHTIISTDTNIHLLAR